MEEKDDYSSLEELFSEGAAEHLKDSITMRLYVNPVLTPEGQMFSLETLQNNGMVNPVTRSKVDGYIPVKPILAAVDDYLEKRISGWLEEITAVLSKEKEKEAGGEAITSLERLLLLARLAVNRDLSCCLNAQRRIAALCSESLHLLVRGLGIYHAGTSASTNFDHQDSPQLGLLRLLFKNECYDLLDSLLSSSPFLFPKGRKVAQTVFGGLWTLANSNDANKKSLGRNLMLHWKPPAKGSVTASTTNYR